jgi:hypothetical protein
MRSVAARIRAGWNDTRSLSLPLSRFNPLTATDADDNATNDADDNATNDADDNATMTPTTDATTEDDVYESA